MGFICALSFYRTTVFYNFLIKINIMGAILIETKDVSELTTQLLKSGKDFTALTNAKQFPHSKN